MSRHKEKDTAWSDPQYMAKLGSLRSIILTDTLEEVIEKALEHPGATLLDWIALPKYLAKEIRAWQKIGGKIFKKIDRAKERVGLHQNNNPNNTLDQRPRKTYYDGEYKVWL